MFTLNTESKLKWSQAQVSIKNIYLLSDMPAKSLKIFLWTFFYFLIKVLIMFEQNSFWSVRDIDEWFAK